MSIIREVDIKITGQVPDDYEDRDFEVLTAKLALICAEYRLGLEIK